MLFLFIVLQSFAQSKLILKVDDQYIFADTSGNILIDQRFDDIDLLSSNYNTYKVFKNGKKGIVRDFKILIPPIYNQIHEKFPNQTNHAYILKLDQNYALANSMGELLSTFDYKDIWDFDIYQGGGSSKTVYYFFKQGTTCKLASLDEHNQFRFEIDNQDDRITSENGCVIAHKGKMAALFRIDPSTGHLIKQFDYRAVAYEFYYDHFYAVDPKANTVEQYNYQFKLVRTLKGTTKVPEPNMEYEDAMEVANVQEYVVEDNFYSHIDLYIWKEEIKRGNYIHLIRDLQAVSKNDFQIKQQLQYLAEMTVSGSKGNLKCEVKSEYRGMYPDIKDTTFVVTYDEIKLSDQQLSTVVPVRKGKMWGVMDVKGREVLPPTFTQVSIVVSNLDNEFIEAQTKQHSYLFYHDVKANTLDTLIIGNPKDHYRVDGYQIMIDRSLKKNQQQIGFTRWYYVPLEIPKMKAFKKVTFYDSIAANSSIPSFTNCYSNGKVGLMAPDGRMVVEAFCDSLETIMCFKVEQGRYQPFEPRYSSLQPIVLAYQAAVVRVYAYNGYELKGEVIKGNTTNRFTVANDGQFLINDLGNDLFDIYSLTGKKLSKEPIQFNPSKERLAQFAKKYWFVQVKDSNGKEVLVGQNGAWFELPER